MLSDEINALVHQVRDGNPSALAELMARVQREVRVDSAACAASVGMSDAVVAEIWTRFKPELQEAEAVVRGTSAGNLIGSPIPGLIDRLRQAARERLHQQLLASAQQAVDHHDALLHIATRSASEALQTGDAGSARSLAESLSERMKQLPPAATGLIERRYRDRLSLIELAAKQGQSPEELAGALCRMRMVIDWSANGQVSVDPGDSRFPLHIEEYIEGTISDDVRIQFGQELMDDISRSAAFERQIRVDMVLAALYHPFALAAEDDSAQRPMPAGSHQMIGAAAPSSRKSAPLRISSDRQAPPQRAASSGAPWMIISIVLMVVGIAALALLTRSHPAASVTSPSSVSTTTTTTIAAAPESGTQTPGATLGQVQQSLGTAYLDSPGRHILAQPGMTIAAGQHLETTGSSSLLKVALADHAELVLNANTAIHTGDTGQILVEHGVVQFNGSPSGKAVQIVSTHVLCEASNAAFALEVGSDGDRLEVERGAVSLGQPGTTTAMVVMSGDRAEIDAHHGISVASGGRLVRGIAFSAAGARMKGVRWLSRRQALADGLQVTAGGDADAASAVHDPALDPELAALLSAGIPSSQGSVAFTQSLPNGSYDVEFWVAGDSASLGSLRLGDAPGTAATPLMRRSGWGKIGPVRTAISNGHLAVSILGIPDHQVCGVAISTAGANPGRIPPMVFLADPTPDRREVLPGPLTLAAEAYDPDGVIREIEFAANGAVIGKVSVAPYTLQWSDQRPGSYQLSARTIMSSGAGAVTEAFAVAIAKPPPPKPTLALQIESIGAAATAPATIQLSVKPEHVASAIAKVEFSASGNPIGVATAAPYQVAWERVAAGTYEVSALATLAGGVTLASAPQSIVIAAPVHRPPQVSVESPTDGEELSEAARPSIKVKATAFEAKLTKVEVMVDGQKVGESAAAPYASTWTGVTPGLHHIQAIASDDHGASASSEAISVIIGKGNAFPMIRGIHLGGPGVEIDGQAWISREQALADGLTISSGKETPEPAPPRARLEPGLVSLLSSSYQSDQDELRLNQETADGIYQVSLWMFEGKAGNAHVADVEVQGVKQPQAIGTLVKGEWARYGPYFARVRNQNLTVVLRRKGSTPPILAGLSLAAPQETTVARPQLEVLFDSIKAYQTPNTGQWATVTPHGVLTPDWPRESKIIPPGGGSGSIDFGPGGGNTTYGVDFNGLGAGIRNWKSFTISAWINCRNFQTGPGGNRIISCTTGKDGFELVVLGNGTIDLGVNSWDDWSGIPASTPGKIAADDKLPRENWRFVAVTYDSTLPKEQVRYFIGTRTEPAILDRAVDSTRGPIAGNPPTLITIGNVPFEVKDRNRNDLFHGLIDQVRLWGSAANGSGALTPDQILLLQGMSLRQSLRPTVSSADAVVAQGLVVWLNAQAGIQATTDRVAQWLDLSGSGHHARQDKAGVRPLLVRKAINGLPALRFTGEECFDLVNSAELESASMTMMVWISQEAYSATGDTRRWIAGKNGNETTDGDLTLLTIGEHPAGFVNIGGGADHQGDIAGTSLLAARSWNHLALSIDGAKERLFVNGRLEAEHPTSRMRTPGHSPVVLGRRGDHWGEWGGLIDEFRVYDRALSEQEIAQIEHHLRTRFFSPVNSPVAMAFTFVGGQEFPGAKGSLERDPSTAHGSASSFKLTGDFTGGGAYVGVWTTIPPMDGKAESELHMWVRFATPMASIGLRIADATDQLHQKTVPLATTTDWQEIVVPLASLDGCEHWGGANDGKWHDAVKALGVNIAPTADNKVPVLWIDDVSIK